MIEELVEALGGLAADHETRVVVLAGDGPDFCAGADFAELEVMRNGPGEFDYGRTFEELLTAISTHPVPVIARVHGARSAPAARSPSRATWPWWPTTPSSASRRRGSAS